MKVTSAKLTSHKISPDWDVKWPDGDAKANDFTGV